MIVYTFLLPFLINISSKYSDNFHALLMGLAFLVMSFFVSDHDIRYKNGLSENSSSDSSYSYVVASQTKWLLSLNNMDFVKANQVEASFAPTQYERALSKIQQPYNQKILFILVESLGVSSKAEVQSKILEPITQQQALFEYYDMGKYQAPDATIQAEIKELCNQDIKGYGLREVILAVSSCRAAVIDTVQLSSRSDVSTLLPSACEFTPTKYVKSISVDANGIIKVLVNEANLPQLDATTNTLTLLPIQTGTTPLVGTTDGGKNIAGWRCGSVTDGTTIPAKYLPGSCRGYY